MCHGAQCGAWIQMLGGGEPPHPGGKEGFQGQQRASPNEWLGRGQRGLRGSVSWGPHTGIPEGTGFRGEAGQGGGLRSRQCSRFRE